MSTFEFRHSDPTHGPVIARIEADNERAARAALRTLIFGRKLSAREIIDVAQGGLAIIDAKTGRRIGEEVCEGGLPTCGPVVTHDSEGVPLCQTCADDLAAESQDAGAQQS